MSKSHWDKGVALYAKELLERLFENNSQEQVAKVVMYGFDTFNTSLLIGAKSWMQYSEGGCSLIYDEDIAERLCPPSQIRRHKDGSIANPNAYETWIEVQARALAQASARAYNICRNAVSISIDKDMVLEGADIAVVQAGC